jgi:hypothetical protein
MKTTVTTTNIMQQHSTQMISRVRTTVMINQPAAPLPPYQISVDEENSRRLTAKCVATEREQILRVLEVEMSCPKVSTVVMLVLEVETSCPKVSTVMFVFEVTDEMTSCPKVVETSCPKVSTAVKLVLEVETSCPKVSTAVMLVLEVETSCPRVSTAMFVLGATDEMTSCPTVSTIL